MFGIIIFIAAVLLFGGLFSRPGYGYRPRRMYPYSSFGGWGMGMRPPMHHGPMHHGPHGGPHHPMGHGPHH